MISITAVLGLIWLHTFADFFLQSDRLAKGKSTSNEILTQHILIYSLPFVILAFWHPVLLVAKYIFVNAVLHFSTDYISSRLTSYFWKKEERHWFFCTIGVDQAIHFTCLILTYVWIFS